MLQITEKKVLRKYFLEKRKSLTNNELTVASQQICDNFFANISISSSENIHIFLPILQQNEIDTWLIISRLQKYFPTVNIIFPRMLKNGELESFLFTKETILEKNALGIEEPIPNSQFLIPNSQIDLVLLPLLIFDKNGNRVGYGKGFYDRFLTKCRTDVLKIGLSVFEPVEAITDVNEHDIKLDLAVTPSKIWTF